jgi:hypothetical protein
MKKTLLKIGFSLGVIALISSCELDQVSPTDLANAGTTLKENTNAEMGVIEVFENVNNFGFRDGSEKSVTLLGTKPTITWSGLTMTLDFTSVPGASGKIIVTFSGVPGYTPGVVATISFENYVNTEGIGMAGVMKLAIEQFVPATSAKFSMITDGDITITEDGSSYFWACDQYFDWAEGLATLTNGDDDVFIMNGTSTQTQDTLINNMTLTDLKYASDCKYLMDGELVIVKDAGSTNELKVTCDFGVDANGIDNGACDGFVKMTAGSLTLTIDLDSK